MSLFLSKKTCDLDMLLQEIVTLGKYVNKRPFSKSRGVGDCIMERIRLQKKKKLIFEVF